MNEFPIHISNLLKARFPYLYISTWEEQRVLHAIHRVVRDPSLIKTTRTLFTWSVTSGMCEFGHHKVIDCKTPIHALETIAGYDRPAVFVLKDFHVYFGYQHRASDPQVIRKIRDLFERLKQSPNPKNVIFTSPVLVLPQELQKDITIVDFDLPNFHEIKALLDEMIRANRQTGRIIIDLREHEAERLAKAALGLTLNEAENAFARAMVADGKLDIGDLSVILEEKRQIIKKSEILEFIATDIQIEDVGGLENLKRWLKKRNKSWLDSAAIYGLPSPKGVLITGVPGCGKSLIAKAISAMWQLPLLRLDMGKIFSGIVGSSEENMRKAIKTVEAISPSILWIDEIEKGFSSSGSSSGDSGTSSRIFGTFLTWMQEKTKPVFVIATANNIHALPAELLRKGRFDEIFFVDLPTKKERVDIFNLHIRKRLRDRTVIGDLVVDEAFLETLATRTEGFVGAEIEQMVIAALFEAFSEDRSITAQDFEKAIVQTVPLSITQREQINDIRQWANVRAVAATPREDSRGYVQASVPVEASTGKTISEPNESDVFTARGGRAIDF